MLTPLPYLRRYKGLFATSIVLMFVGAGVALLAPWPLAFLVDSALGEKPPPPWVANYFGSSATQMILVSVVATIALAVLAQSMAVIDSYVNTKLEQRIALDFRSDLFDHCQNLSQAFHDQRGTGMFMYTINFEAHNAGVICVAIPQFLQSVLTIVGMFYVTYRLAPSLSLLALAVVPVIYYSTIYYARRIEPSVQAVRVQEGRSIQIVSDVFLMLRVVVGFNRQSHEWARFRRQGEDAVGARVKVTVSQTLFGLVVAVTTAVGTGAIIGVGAQSVVSHALTVGELLIVMAYVHEIYQPMTTISSTLASFQVSLAALRGADRLMKTVPDVQDPADGGALGPVAGNLEFRDVSFNYAGRAHTLTNVSFAARAGDVVAVVGPTGAGKTTLASLMARFYDPQDGRVLVDGIDVRAVTQESLRRHISMVWQEPSLFPETIGDNIRYGRLDATDDAVMEAAKQANAHDFIMRLPNGYDTPAGERGGRLSGGERQRICIARAFIKDAPILILDEPTASVDSRTESVILEALNRLMEGRTTIMVAHRLSTVRHADLILVMNDGEIVERGCHDELLAAGGLYCVLWQMQTQSQTARPTNEHTRRLERFKDTLRTSFERRLKALSR